MGNRLTEEEQQTEARSFGEVFDEMFPHYLVMGMTPEQYWDGENWLKKAFRKAYQIRMENEERITDRNMWMMGLYVRDALHSVLLLVNGFVPKGAEVGKYPEKPRLEEAEAQRREENKKKKEEEQQRLAMAMLQAQFARFNKRFEEKHSQEPQKL